MAKYRYAGDIPAPDEAGELLHPGDVREHDTPPDCPPWEPVDEPESAPAAAEGPPATEETPEPSPGPLTPNGM